MESTPTNIPQLLTIALKNSISNDPMIIKESELFIQGLQKGNNNFCFALIAILSKKEDNNLAQISSIQLKNSIVKEWKSSFTDQLKTYIKDNIFFLLINAIDKVELKQYKIILTKLLKYEEKWESYMPNVIQCINGDCKDDGIDFKGYCGILAFYLYAKKHEFEMDNRKIYDDCYNMIHKYLLRKYIVLIQKNNSINEIETKCLIKITKIWNKSIKISPPDIFINDFNDCFKCIVNYKPGNVQLIRNCLLFLETLYQRYIGKTDLIDKGTYSYEFFTKNYHLYTSALYNYFMYYITTRDNTSFLDDDEKSMASCYRFLLLSMNREDELIYPLIQNDFEKIIIASIRNNIQNRKDLELQEKNYIYSQFDIPLDSKRKTIESLFEKITKNKQMCNQTINILFNQLTIIENNINQEKIPFNLLLKESVIFLCQVLIKKKTSTIPSNILHEIVGKFISNDLNLEFQEMSTITNTSLDNTLCINSLKFRYVYFISLILETKPFNQEEINYLINQISKGMLLKDNLIIKTICAITLPNLIIYSSETIAFFQQSISQLLSLYIALIREIELDELIANIETIINIYPNETLQFAFELSKEIVIIFQKYMIELADCDQEEETNIDSAACGVIDLLCALLQICKGKEIFEQVLVNCEEMISFALSNETCNISMMIFERAIWLVGNILEISNSINSFMWKWYQVILGNVITYTSHPNDINTTETSEGKAFEILQKITPVIYYFIVRDPTSFIQYYNSTIQTIQSIINLSQIRKDEVFPCYAIKIIISIFETYSKTNTLLQLINNSLNSIIQYLLTLLFSATKQMYTQILIQSIALIINYDPINVIQYITNTHQLEKFLGKWMDGINVMVFEFEYRRSVYGLFSIFTINPNHLPSLVKTNYTFLVEKGFLLLNKLAEMNNNTNSKLKSNKGDDEAEVSGNEGDDEEIEEDEHDSIDNDNFIEYDQEDDEDEDDDDYNPEYDDEDIKIKTLLEKENVFQWIKNVLMSLKQNNNDDQFNFFISKLGHGKLAQIINSIN